MYRVELYARVRRACHVEGMSTREASRVLVVNRRYGSGPQAYARLVNPRPVRCTACEHHRFCRVHLAFCVELLRHRQGSIPNRRSAPPPRRAVGRKPSRLGPNRRRQEKRNSFPGPAVQGIIDQAVPSQLGSKIPRKWKILRLFSLSSMSRTSIAQRRKSVHGHHRILEDDLRTALRSGAVQARWRRARRCSTKPFRANFSSARSVVLKNPAQIMPTTGILSKGFCKIFSLSQ